MNETTFELMAQMLSRWNRGPADVLDVGSLDVNGNYRELITGQGHTYLGLDLEDGKNVDVVSPDPYNFAPLLPGQFDIVISGSTMEHVEAVWLWVPALVQVLKPGGLLCIVTHWQFYEHRHPVDCWRIMPDGMRYLFDQTNALEDYLIRIENERDITGSAFKRGNHIAV